ncbi:MAG: dihydroorotate dehydrogenase [bacterium]
MKFEVSIRGIEFPNPVLAASGTFGFGLEFPRLVNQLGGLVTKGVTVEPRGGNPPPRIAETPSGVVNSVGLENPGVQWFKEKIVPHLHQLKCPVLVNLAGRSVDEFCFLTELLEDMPVSGLELNLSCPNVKEGGVIFGQEPKRVAEVTAAVRRRTKKLLVVKLTANFVDPKETAKAAEAAGADAVSLINTLFALVLDEAGNPFLGGRTGGLSGPAIKPFALFCVERVAGAVKIPVIGIGGIKTGRDAFEFICAGAHLVQVGTANLISPDGAVAVVKGLRRLGQVQRWQSWDEVRGRARKQ